jgi:anthranilate synthase/indole-3-glycerol phosphate synthase/phosphoribosylanthranilate isomerase
MHYVAAQHLLTTSSNQPATMIMINLLACCYSLVLLSPFSQAFAPTVHRPKRVTRTVSATRSSTDEPTMKHMDDHYSPSQQKAALDSLLADSGNPLCDGRHIFGFGMDDHNLSTLQTITATRILDYQTKMAEVSSPSMEELLEKAKEFQSKHGPLLNLQKVISSQAPRMALAAEFKRSSPSKGDIATHLNAGEQAAKYASAGANIISVLTEPRWFKGSLDDLQEARLQSVGATGRAAILRKEFVVNEYMVAEAAAYGADTVLLIVAVLPQHLLRRLISYSRSIGMEPLVEVHADEELEVALEAGKLFLRRFGTVNNHITLDEYVVGAKVIGVNNRNLHTFQMDLDTTRHVAGLLESKGKVFAHGDPNAEYTLCALSGMSTASDVNRYRENGVGMCLIGESLMRAADPHQAIAGLCLDRKDFEVQSGSGVGGAYTGGTKLFKVCGITTPDDALVAVQAGANLIGVIFAVKSKRCVSSVEAKQVADAVRAFGERTSSIKIQNKGEQGPLPHLVSMAHQLEDAARRPLVVGVFQNQDSTFIQRMVTECGLDLVQLHGQEGMEGCNEALTGAPTIRVVDVETDPITGKAIASAVDDIMRQLTTDPVAVLLDTSIKGSKDGGGTGVTFDWSIAEKFQNAGLPVIIAGGLTPENVGQAVQKVRPWGIDVSSGVEASPGRKDHEKVKAFIQSAREAAVESSKGF